MAKYIEREALVEWLKRIPLKDLSDGLGLCRVIMEDDFKKAIKKMPKSIIVDVAPIRHGHWIMKKTSAGASYTVCSHCNASVKYNDEYGTVVMNLKGANYCPNCGAKMDRGTENATD